MLSRTTVSCRFAAKVGLAAAGSGLIASAASGQLGFAPFGSFSAPTGGSSSWDVAADGRIVAVFGDGSVRRQLAPSSGTYTSIGSIDGTIFNSPFGNFGPGFVRLSPDGTRLAIGDNAAADRVHLVSVSALGAGVTSTFAVSLPNYSAAWTSNSQLMVSGASFGPGGSSSVLSRVDLTSPTSASTTTVITSIGDGSGGVARFGSIVYAAIGFDGAGLSDGTIRAFSLPALAFATTPITFSSGGLVTQLLSAASVDTTPTGLLVVAGSGGVAVFNPLSGVSQQLITGGFYSARVDPSTGDVLAQSFGGATIQRFSLVPAPSGMGLIALAGVVAARRRRSVTKVIA